MIIAGADKGNPFSPFPTEFGGSLDQTTTDRKIGTIDFIIAKAQAQSPRSTSPCELSVFIERRRLPPTKAKGRR